jgi:hypothetical protein
LSNAQFGNQPGLITGQFICLLFSLLSPPLFADKSPHLSQTPDEGVSGAFLCSEWTACYAQAPQTEQSGLKRG